MTNSESSAVPGETSPLTAKLAALQERHPGWHIWLSRDHRMLGATLCDHRVGVSRTVIKDTAEELHEALEQERKAAKRPALPHLNPAGPR